MSRIIAAQSVGKKRNQLRRTIAEALHRMIRKPNFDQESQDLAALIVFSLQEIEKGVEQTATAWEKRDYYLKADRFRCQWEWINDAAFALETALLIGQAEQIPEILATLIPRFSDITVGRYTRATDMWAGCYQRLVHGKS